LQTGKESFRGVFVEGAMVCVIRTPNVGDQGAVKAP